MRIILPIFLGLVLLSCNTNDKSKTESSKSTTEKTIVDKDKASEKSDFESFVSSFKTIQFPFEIGEKTIWKSTYVEMEGLATIELNNIDKFFGFEENKSDSIGFHELLRFYKVGQIPIDSNIYGIIYLKSYRSQYVKGGKKDIYKIATFDSNGNLISQKDIAGFITDYSKGDDRAYWNTCKIDKDLVLDLEIKEMIYNYDTDEEKVASLRTEKYNINKNGEVITGANTRS